MNTFAFVGDLEGSPEVSCVYHSEEAENQVGAADGRAGGWVGAAGGWAGGWVGLQPRDCEGWLASQ